MTKKDFMDLTGENPEDMFGGDWQNEVNDLLGVEKINPCTFCNTGVEDLSEDICPKCYAQFERKLAKARAQYNAS